MIFKIPKFLAKLLEERIKNKERDDFNIALEDPGYIDQELVKQGSLFPYTQKYLDKIKPQFYKMLESSGIEKVKIFATKYANEKTGRLTIPTSKRPLAVSEDEWQEYLDYYEEGYELYEKGDEK